MNGEIFRVYLERCLVPTLKLGDIVVMENLPAHKNNAVQDMIEAGGAQLHYLPPYSPGLNPIEIAFAKRRAHLRKAAERSIPALWDRVGSILNLCSLQQCKNFFNHAGYAQSQSKISSDYKNPIYPRGQANLDGSNDLDPSGLLFRAQCRVSFVDKNQD